jgi:outer membrane protein assembly factor BamE (lipoprotein component of BamABCDE complex)
VAELESRMAKMEQLLDEKFADDRWREPILWSRIRRGMSHEDVRKLLGKPARVEEAIFTTWYYHETSKEHSHVWFDEGEVLGWEGLEQEHRPPKRLGP